MNIYVIIVDSFLDDFESACDFADDADYRPYRSEVDDVEYPFICPLSQDISDSVKVSLERLMGPISIRHVFLRASPAGVCVPNRVHNDIAMGRYSLMLYMNHDRHCQGGTSFLRHRKHGMERGPSNAVEAALAKRDSNDPDKWQVTMTCPMVANRALIFPAELMHQAEPYQGFGEGRNARRVLTAFFDLEQPYES